MTWNEFTKKVKDFFLGETGDKADTAKYADDEKALIEQIKEIADSYNPTYEPSKGYEDLSELLPEKMEFEYRKYEGDDEDGIKNNTTQKYKDLLDEDSKIVSDKYDTKVGEVENKKKTASEESALKVQSLDKKYADVEKAIINGLIQKGLYNSSIKGSQTKANEESKEYEKQGLSDELSKKIGTY
ncbi:MAG: hypothetical protein K2J13_03300, partial [Clostridia bacterium]|nr:hypothetical protein [Clostridia bacterium]